MKNRELAKQHHWNLSSAEIIEYKNRYRRGRRSNAGPFFGGGLTGRFNSACLPREGRNSSEKSEEGRRRGLRKSTIPTPRRRVAN